MIVCHNSGALATSKVLRLSNVVRLGQPFKESVKHIEHFVAAF